MPRGFGQLVVNLPTGPPVGRPKDQKDNSNPQHLEKDQLHPVPRCGMQAFLACILLVLALVSRPSKRRLALSRPAHMADGAARRDKVRLAMTTLLVALLVGGAACSVPYVSPSGGLTSEDQEWRGQIVEVNRAQGYMVVRSPERLLDHVFQITRETEITAEDGISPTLTRGQWVAVRYREDRSDQAPPVAVRVEVIR